MFNEVSGTGVTVHVVRTTGVGKQKSNRELWLAFVVAKLMCSSISAARTNQQRETREYPEPAPAPRKSETTSDSDSASMKPHQETWRVIGGGVMLGTATSTSGHGIRSK